MLALKSTGGGGALGGITIKLINGLTGGTGPAYRHTFLAASLSSSRGGFRSIWQIGLYGQTAG